MNNPNAYNVVGFNMVSKINLKNLFIGYDLSIQKYYDRYFDKTEH